MIISSSIYSNLFFLSSSIYSNLFFLSFFFFFLFFFFLFISSFLNLSINLFLLFARISFILPSSVFWACWEELCKVREERYNHTNGKTVEWEFSAVKPSVGGENLKASKVETKLKDGHVWERFERTFFQWGVGKKNDSLEYDFWNGKGGCLGMRIFLTRIEKRKRFFN